MFLSLIKLETAISASNDDVLSYSQVSRVHKLSCSSLELSEDARYLLTAGDRVVKVWDYQMRFDINFQVLDTREKSVAPYIFPL